MGGACARNAPPLPPDLGDRPPSQRLLVGDAESAEGRMDCTQLKNEAIHVRATIGGYEQVIAGNRGQNQAAVYIGSAIFLPALLAARTDEDTKKSLDDLQVKRDRIDRLSKAKACGTDAN